MKVTEVIQMQTVNTSSLDQSMLCGLNVEVINAPTAPLIHQSARFLLINGGEGIIRIQNKDYSLKPGSIVSILPWEISEVIKVENSLQYYLLIYRFDTINHILKTFFNIDNQPVDVIQEMRKHPVVYCDKIQQKKVHEVLLCLRDEVGIEAALPEPNKNSMASIYITAKLIELIVLYMRTCSKSGAIPGKAEAALDRSEIFQYMYSHLGEKLTMKMLSKVFYLSESVIRQYITQVTGLSFFDLLNEMRLGKTINFLLYTDLTLNELAEIMGYVDAAHISKVFSARMGMKLNEYRKTYQRIGEICKVKESQKVYTIVEYIYRNYPEPLTAKSVANHFGTGVRELQKVLLYQVERNFEDFLNYIRITKACVLLLDSTKSVLEIGEEVGYNSNKTFTRNFLKIMVMTPNDFRKNVTLQEKF